MSSFGSHSEQERLLDANGDEESQPHRSDGYGTTEAIDQGAQGTVLAGQEVVASLDGVPPEVVITSNKINPTVESQENPMVLKARRSVKKMLPILLVGTFLASLDRSVVAANYAIIATELGALNLAPWIATAYLLSISSTQTLYGRLSDSFGRKTCLLFCYSTFAVGSLLCGLARSMPALIAARAVQGVGASGMSTLVTVLLTDVIPFLERTLWQGYMRMVISLGTGIGAPLGGAISEWIGWRWIFLGQAIICFLNTMLVGQFLRLPKPELKNLSTQLKRIDFLGATLLISTIILLMVGIDLGSNKGWKSPAAIGALAAVPVLLLLYFLVELKLAVEPFTPGHIIFNKLLAGSYIWCFFEAAGHFALFYYIPLFYQAVLRLSPVQAGSLLLPGAASTILGGFFGGIYIKKQGKFYYMFAISNAIIILGTVPILLFANFTMGFAQVASGISFCLFVIGFVHGITISSFHMVLGEHTPRILIVRPMADRSTTKVHIPPADRAIATACNITFRSLGAALGTSLSGAVIQQRLRIRLEGIANGDEGLEKALEDVRNSLDAIKMLPPRLQASVRDSSAGATRWALGVQMGSFVVAFLGGLGMKEVIVDT